MSDPLRGNLIAGEWRLGGDVFDNLNPSDTREVVSRHATATPQDVADALTAARHAAPGWRDAGVQARADVLDALASEILARNAELGRVLASEEGKTLAEAIGEVTRAGQLFRFFAGEAIRLDGQCGESTRRGLRVEVRREPLGVVGLITPWNFPIAIPAWKLAPALAFGNTVVMKPSELAPLSAWLLAEMLVRAGLPASVLNLVQGGGPAGRALVESPGLDGLSFTGSVATGTAIAHSAGPRMLRLQLEMGGKNPLVVLDDADLETAVECALNGAFYSTGQRCTASSRLIVTAGIHDRFVARLTERTRALRVGHALSAETQIGPVVDARQLAKDLDYIRIGCEEGARLACGGASLTRDTPGHYLQPALFVETRNAMRINREEVFGPVAAVIRAGDADEALHLANDTEYGLCAGVCTTSLRQAERFRRELQTGLAMVNLPTAGLDYHLPFGGRKHSSHGPREQGAAAREFYTVSKTAYLAY